MAQELDVNWGEFKNAIRPTWLIQYVETNNAYYLAMGDHTFLIRCFLDKTNPIYNTDIIDFESNYKNNCNQKIKTEVVTQFEKDDKVLKLFCGSANVNAETSEATILVQIPGTPGTNEGRYIAGGMCWFDSVVNGDKIIKVEVIDVENLMGYGNNIVLRKWYDEEANETNQGWFFSTHKPTLSVEPIGGYGFIPSGLYLKIVGKKANNITQGTLFVNLFWAKGE